MDEHKLDHDKKHIHLDTKPLEHHHEKGETHVDPQDYWKDIKTDQQSQGTSTQSSEKDQSKEFTKSSKGQ